MGSREEVALAGDTNDRCVNIGLMRGRRDTGESRRRRRRYRRSDMLEWKERVEGRK